MFYSKILEEVDKGGHLDNCSIILKGVALDLNQIRDEVSNYLVKMSETYLCSSITRSNDRFIIRIESYDIEPCEDFDVNYDAWNKFTEKISEKYGFDFSVPSSYWGK